MQADQFRQTIASLHAEKDFSWMGVVMDAEVERTTIHDLDFLRNVSVLRGQGQPVRHESPSESGKSSPVELDSIPESWLRLVAHSRISCRVLPSFALGIP